MRRNFAKCLIVFGVILSGIGLADENFSFRGQLKPIVGLKQLRQENLYLDSLIPYQEDRLRFETSFSKNWFYAEVVNETSYFIEKKNTPFFPFAISDSEPFWNPVWKIDEAETTLLKTRLDRAYVQASFDAFELRVGKQIVPIGVGHIFTTISQTPRYPFIVVDPEYDKTEDAATLIWKQGIKLEARYLARDKGKEKDNFHLRWLFRLAETDAVLTAGQTDGKKFAAFEGSRSVGDAVLRAELSVYEREERYFTEGLIGWDKVWNAKWSSKTEVFYNGFGNETYSTLEPFPHRSSNFRGKLYFGNLLGYEWTPKWKVNFLALANLNDPSFLLHLYFNYSLSDNVDLIAGHYQNLKTKDTSEFGGKLELPTLPTVKLGLPDLTYLLMRWAF